MALSTVDRVFGLEYPMSMPTSLAFEGLLKTGEHANDKGEPPIHQYRAIFVNVRTLFRNVYNAFGDKKAELDANIALAAIEEDVKTIRETVTAVSPSTICVFYLCQYKTVNKEFPQAKFKNPTTPIAVHYNSVEMDVYRKVINEKLFDVKLFDVEIKNNVDTVCLTHLPMDLLWRKHFPKLALLESHTGKVKGPLEWYTKLNGKPENIPFNKATLQLYGDGVMFSPEDLKSRRVLEKVAQKYNWNQSTTQSRMRQSLRIANEPFLIEYLNRLDD
ncbi:hypothetical protein PHOBOS_30 [Erwinia phage vB_EamM_Phobos]|uniref:hypothetical protein n=1 Tax=Erwinia phage vB_EamM_Phobos TaxID=1883377 RepID=UPI00081CB423|nr:hypothetical protein BIZ79_gp030 [Erwinia phage vB_EamM_Phobos]ANZ50220.1 hypothetical protein PHOBOS_30 [Erwinia phage vB_EamM_Phobos]